MRYSLLDSLRGMAVLEMLAFHLCFDLNVLTGVNPDWPWLPKTVLWQQQIVYLFIFVAGMSCALMKPEQHFRRGIFLNILGLIITAATLFFVPAQPIHFGILTFIGSALLLSFIVEDKGWLLAKAESTLGSLLCMLLCLMLLVATYSLQTGVLRVGGQVLGTWPQWPYEHNWAWLGFPAKEFFSSDYVPVLPHIFAFWLGWFYLRYLQSHNARLLMVSFNKRLEYLGRNSLLIYFVHQPLILAILTVLGYFKL